MFLAYPAGGGGVAMFLLRLSVIASLTALAKTHSIPAPLTGMVALAMALGFRTRVAALASGAFALFALASFEGAKIELLTVLTLDAAALAIIGPGAFSIDAVIFGRRTIDVAVPPRTKV